MQCRQDDALKDAIRRTVVHLAMAEKRCDHAEEKGAEERHGCRMAIVRNWTVLS